MLEDSSTVINTVISNSVIVLIAITFLFLRKPIVYSGTIYINNSFAKTFSKLFWISDSEIADLLGREGFLYLSLLKYLSITLLFYSFMGLISLLPTYDQSLPNSLKLSHFSIENMSNKDSDLIIPAICILFFFTGIYFIAYFYIYLPYNNPEYFPSVTHS